MTENIHGESLIGKTVRYHGSIISLHSKPMFVEQVHHTPRGVAPGVTSHKERYLLVYGPKRFDYILNVRRESFTVVEDGHA